MIDPKRQIPASLPNNVNLEWFDALVRHQIYTQRLAGSVRDRVVGILNDTEKDLAMRVRDALAGKTQMSPARIARAKALMKQIRILRTQAWERVQKVLDKEMKDFTVAEADHLKRMLDDVFPVSLDIALPSAQALKNLVTTRPFEGAVMSSWAKRLQRRDLERIENAINIGLVQGESSQSIARRIFGSGALRGRNGVTQLTRNNVQAIVRTAVNSYSNGARGEFLQTNSDFFNKEVFVATLDSRTTLICIKNDGKRFPVGEGPIPPLHWQCRSLRVAEINGEVLGDRPAKPFTQKMLLKEFAEKNQLGRVTSRKNLPRGYRGKFDSFAGRRIREMTGRVPAKVTYREWLKRQSVEFQNEVLGKGRAELFRSGKLTVDKFVDNGKVVPLEQLKQPRPKIIQPKAPVKLTELEKLHIRDYTATSFEEINYYQRTGKLLANGTLTKTDITEAIDQLEKGTAKLPSVEGTTYRGLAFKSRNELDTFLKRLKDGSVIENESFWSTSMRPEMAQTFRENFKFGTILRIEGRTGRLLGNYADQFSLSGIDEVLFRKGTRFRVLRDGDIITLREL